MIILTLIFIIAALVIVIIDFAMDRLAIKKIKSGMRTLNKKIEKLKSEAKTYDDTQMDPETEEEEAGGLPVQPDSEVSETGR